MSSLVQSVHADVAATSVSAVRGAWQRPATVAVLAGQRLGVRSERPIAWRDVAQSFAADAAEMPILTRLLGGQMALLLGYASLRGALALHQHGRGGRAGSKVLAPRSARRRPWRRALLASATASAGLAFVWTTLALVSRTRAVPVVTALFAYGHALWQYLPLRRPLVRDM
ncbi:MAG: hypothetical protein ACHQ4H_01600 [Ktedonobacterales bacterium]